MATRKIMTVDDSPTVRHVLNYTLNAAGYEVVEAINGKDALTKFEDDSIEMLITDLNMPELDGLGLIRKVRSNPSNRFLPIIMLTTETGEDMKKEGKLAGASAWLTKPFKPEQLLSLVRTVLA